MRRKLLRSINKRLEKKRRSTKEKEFDFDQAFKKKIMNEVDRKIKKLL